MKAWKWEVAHTDKLDWIISVDCYSDPFQLTTLSIDVTRNVV